MAGQSVTDVLQENRKNAERVYCEVHRDMVECGALKIPTKGVRKGARQHLPDIAHQFVVRFAQKSIRILCQQG